MKRVAWGATLLVAGMILLARPLRAETLTLRPSQDTTIFSESTNSNGAGSRLFVGMTRRGDIRRGLVQFDLRQLPPGAMITSAAVTLSIVRSASASSGTILALHRLTASWGEAGSTSSTGSGASPQRGDATWRHRFFPDTSWAREGGDFLPDPSAAGMESGTEVTVRGEGLLADVETWLATPAENHGWILRGDESVPQSARAYINPALTVEFSVSEAPPTAGGEAPPQEPGETAAAPAVELGEPGGALRFSVSLRAGPLSVDVYLGYVTPAGEIVTLTLAEDRLAERRGIEPIVRGFLPVDLSAVLVYARPFGAADAPGGYLLFAALAPVGADPLNLGGLISLSTVRLELVR